MKRLRLLIALLLISILQNSLAQEEKKGRTVYAELFGQGFVPFSFHYEQRGKEINAGYATLGAGLVIMPTAFGSGYFYGLPLACNWVFGKKKHHFYMGFGVTPMFNKGFYKTPNTPRFDLYISPKIGYRFQTLEKGPFLSVNMNAIMGVFRVNKSATYPIEFRNLDTMGFLRVFPWPGLALGWSF